MMSVALRILIVEDSEKDAVLLLRQLRSGDHKITFERVDTPAAMLTALNTQKWDLIISDYFMPHFSAPAALKLLQESGLDLPFIIVSGAIGEETAVAAMKSGAHDYIMKGNLARLIPAIERELREAEVRLTRQQAEEQIKASLQEKEVLLKEIHHRVKNNMQIISSLLSLQANYLKDNRALEIFKVSQNRIETMALIHEKLYQSKDLARIDFADYVHELVVDLFSAYAVHSNGITLNINVEELFLSIDAAIPCGLIVNELVLNSLKYAFPAGRAGEICIELHSVTDNKLALIVSDNGVGFPKDLDFQNTTSLGLRLVNALTIQLEATIELNRDSGVEFKIVFGVKV